MIRVTQILDYFCPPELVAWRVKMGNRSANLICRQAAKVGTRIDELIKTGGEPTKKDTPEVVSAYRAFQKWRAVYSPSSIITCTRLVGRIGRHEITGEPDILVDGELHDIKATSAVRKKNWIQLNVYEELRRQNGLIPSPTLRPLRLDPNTEGYQYPDAQPFDADLVRLFGSLCDAYAYYKGDDDGGHDVQEADEIEELA